MRFVEDINQYGTTALMRAAQDGDIDLVRALLENGADPNVRRKDGFTALALAAFFGHTEIVRVLLEHGADSRASTRAGTSPRVWATARAFNDVVDQLESHPVTKPPHRPPPPPAPTVPTPMVPAPTIRTLKDPPEIWELVHEVPKGFKAGSTFMTRVQSMKARLAVPLAVAMLFVAAATLGWSALKLKQKVEKSSAAAQPQQQALPEPGVSIRPESSTADVTSPPTSIEVPAIATTIPPNGSRPQIRRLSSQAHRNSSGPVAREVVASTRSAEVPQVAPATLKKPDSPSVPDVAPRSKGPVPASSQLIAPAAKSKSKPKVIQWP